MAYQEDIAARKNKASKKKDVLRARVVSNYGDVGLTEQTYFDILSRFVIVMFEPADNVIITQENIARYFAIVRRPRELWIDVDGGIQSPASNQMRSDYIGNVNKGTPSAYSIKNIPGINRPYSLGEEIVVKKLDVPLYFSNALFSSSFDSSQFSVAASKYVEAYLTRDPTGPGSVSNVAANWDVSRIYPLFPAGGTVTRAATLFGDSYTGASVAGFLNASLSYNTKQNQGNPTAAQLKNYDAAYHYGVGINKFQFEVFWRYVTENLATVDSIIGGNYQVANYNDNYFWTNTGKFRNSTLLMRSCFYEDMNVDNKARVPSNECLPLIVTQPNTFPIPKARNVGTILFNPSFSQIVN